MPALASLADQGLEALQQRDHARLAALMDDNFRLRRQLFGDAALAASLPLVETAQSVGAAAKLTGSGGAVVALCMGGESQVGRLRQACRQRGLECVEVEPGPVHHIAGG